MKRNVGLLVFWIRIINWFTPSVGGDINYSLLETLEKYWRTQKSDLCGWEGILSGESWKACGHRSRLRHGVGVEVGLSSPCEKERIEQVRSVTVNIYIGQMLANVSDSPVKHCIGGPREAVCVLEHSAASPENDWLNHRMSEPKVQPHLCLLGIGAMRTSVRN